MDDSNKDSFELFADTLTITLGCVLFIALLLVTITRSHTIDESGLFQIERRSELLKRQVPLAEASVYPDEALIDTLTSADPGMDDLLLNYENATRSALDQFFQKNPPHYARALANENVRSQVFLSKYNWLMETIQTNIKSLGDRIERAFTEASNDPIALSVLREQDKSAPVPVYLVLKNQKIYPVEGGPGKSYRHISWTPVHPSRKTRSSQVWHLQLIEDAGLDKEAAEAHLRALTGKLSRKSESQIVLLVYQDSFQRARHVLRSLSQREVNFSWRPLETDQRILMSSEGLPPPAPF